MRKHLPLFVLTLCSLSFWKRMTGEQLHDKLRRDFQIDWKLW